MTLRQMNQGSMHWPKIQHIIGMVVLTWSVVTGTDLQAQFQPDSRWWKGNLHTHSLWSDGDDFPEMIVDWYAQRDYHFLVLSDHNVLSEGERWMANSEIVRRGGPQALEKYRLRFGPDWIESRRRTAPPEKPADNELETWETRLKTLAEFRKKFESNGKFLMMPAEEITDRVGKLPVHMNASNLPQVIQPQGGATVREAIVNNLRAVNDLAERTGQKVLVHLNHPNFGWAITPEDLAYVAEEQFFEIYNGHPSVNQLGDEFRPSLELMWDIANTLRIDQFKTAPLYGLATDDCHNYHGNPGSQPGRGWVQVRARFLTPDHLISAMKRGDFYASSGVVLKDVQFDATTKKLRIEIEPQADVEFVTQIVGTPRDYDRTWPAGVDSQGNPVPVKQRYCPKIGTVFAKFSGNSVEYQMTGDELYVRAVITSSRPHPNPSFEQQYEQAWTQPFGWKKE